MVISQPYILRVANFVQRTTLRFTCLPRMGNNLLTYRGRSASERPPAILLHTMVMGLMSGSQIEDQSWHPVSQCASSNLNYTYMSTGALMQVRARTTAGCDLRRSAQHPRNVLKTKCLYKASSGSDLQLRSVASRDTTCPRCQYSWNLSIDPPWPFQLSQ